MKKSSIFHKINPLRKLNGFRLYLFKIISSNILLVLAPICILGLFWFSMIFQQAEHEFHQQKTIEINEAVSGIRQRINTIKLEVAFEKRDRRYSTYTKSDQYTTDLWLISKRLVLMTEKYPLLYSVYFYDKTTGRIYNSSAGSYIFASFYDNKWIENTQKTISVQQLPLRYSMPENYYQQYNSPFYKQYNKLVLSLVIRGVPDFYLVANISIDDLYKDIANAYELNQEQMEFFFLDENGKLIEGSSKYSDTNSLLQKSNMSSTDKVIYFTKNSHIYFMKKIDCGIICVTSYPIRAVYQESVYLMKYILIVCFSVFIFLLAISTYMAKKLYQPINTLYSEIATSTKDLQTNNIHDEIDMLKQAFIDMNTFNSDAKLKLKQFNEISKTFGFRNFLEHSKHKYDFVREHPYLFDQNGNGLCEILIIKINSKKINKSQDEEMLFCLNLQEVLRIYLQSLMKGILTKVGKNDLVLLYQSSYDKTGEPIRTVLTNTVIKLTEKNAYFAVSNPIHRIDEVISEFHRCQDLIKTSYFFDWKNQIITQEQLIRTQKENENYNIYDMLLNINTALIRNIISQNEYQIQQVFTHLESELRTIMDISHIKDICNRIMIELDQEFHFSITLGINLLQLINSNDTLIDIINLMKNILKRVSNQYGKNDAKENYYCEQVKNYMQENYMQDMNITDAADYLNISYSYLSKLFRSKTGYTLSDYLNNLRVEKSKEYLKNTFLNLTEVSEKVGYNNVQSYQRFFKKYSNITPGDYRKLHNKATL